jgi:hypothetical protein
MDYNSDFKYDLKVGCVKERELGDIFNSKKIEVKYDRCALTTGNVFVEYSSRGSLSGISTTQSDYYCFAIGDTFHIIRVNELRDRARKYLGGERDVFGGDSNTSKGILLPIQELF